LNARRWESDEDESELIEIEINTKRTFKLNFIVFAEFAIHSHCTQKDASGEKEYEKKGFLNAS
jgi:hypothetical protein